jgi:hypothetical protein
MGLFVPNLEQVPTVDGLIATAEANLKLFKEHREPHILSIAAGYIDRAEQLALVESNESVPKHHDQA